MCIFLINLNAVSKLIVARSVLFYFGALLKQVLAGQESDEL